MSTNINSFLSINNSNSVNELFETLPAQPKKEEIPVTLVFTAGEVGVSSNPRKRPATVNLTENQIEAKIFAHFGLDVGRDAALIKQRLGSDTNPFEQLETKGTFQATYNLKTGNYEIIDNIEAGLYKQLQGKAEQIKTQIETEKQADANKNPNKVVAEKNGIDKAIYARNELEKKYQQNQREMPSVSAASKTDTEVKSITDTIEKVTGTQNQFGSNTVGE